MEWNHVVRCRYVSTHLLGPFQNFRIVLATGFSSTPHRFGSDTMRGKVPLDVSQL